MTGQAVSEAARLLGPLGASGVPLRSLTTFRVGGPADVLVRVRNRSEIERVAAVVRLTGVDVLVVGQGSNLLIADEGFRGVVVVLDGEFSQSQFPTPRPVSAEDDPTTGSVGVVVAGGAVKMPVLARQAAQRGLSGLEWMVGVPGSIGGAVRMNAGGHGSDVAANLVSADVWSLDSEGQRTLDNGELALGYRRSNLRDLDVVLSAVFTVGTCDVAEAEDNLAEIVRWRREHQPGGANCGSVFTNPPADSAGRLIDAAGLRGMRLGTASVSEKHANFIQADGDASAADIWALIITVRQRVFEASGVVLHPEVRTAGFEAALPELSTSPVD